MNNEDFWNRVKILIKKKGWTQRQFSELLGLNPLSIERYIARNTLPDVELGCKIAEKLEVPVDTLITGKPSNYNLSKKKEEILKEIDKLQNLVNHLK